MSYLAMDRSLVPRQHVLVGDPGVALVALVLLYLDLVDDFDLLPFALLLL